MLTTTLKVHVKVQPKIVKNYVVDEPEVRFIETKVQTLDILSFFFSNLFIWSFHIN